MEKIGSMQTSLSSNSSNGEASPVHPMLAAENSRVVKNMTFPIF